jgi:ABC-type lipoprotein export system ATPase subunit
MLTLVEDLGQTIVMVTHDPNVASIASRLICIRDGEIEQDGTPTDILGRNPTYLNSRN